MNWAASLGFDSEELYRRRAFLTGRAEWHVEMQTGKKGTAPPSQLFAATLLRDAGAISIILGDFVGARELLYRAAIAYLSQDVLYGLLLATLAGDHSAWSTHGQSLGALRLYLAQPDFGRERIPQDIPLPYVPQSDLVSALQSYAVAPPQLQRRKKDEHSGERQLLKQLHIAVEEGLGIQAEVAPSSLYIRTLLTLTADEREFAGDELRIERNLVALSAAREAEITAARKDEFNWSLMQNPADVVDFDTIVLATALEARGIRPSFIDRIFGSIDDPVALPIHASRQLLPGAHSQ